MPDSLSLYLLLIAVIAGERFSELVLSRRNRRWALARGGVEVGQGHYPFMVAVHAAFLLSCGLEPWLLQRPWRPTMGGTMLVLVALSMSLRYWAISTLGRRWNTRVVVLPGVPLVAAGPYRRLRHPNYVAVIVEIFALPLVHSAWLTAVVFTLLNVVVLRTRIAVEERALSAHAVGGEALPQDEAPPR